MSEKVYDDLKRDQIYHMLTEYLECPDDITGDMIDFIADEINEDDDITYEKVIEHCEAYNDMFGWAKD